MKRLVSLALALLAFIPFTAQAGTVTPLVDVTWLQSQLEAERIGEDVIVIDIRNKIDGGSAKTFVAGHIPGAVYSNYLGDGWRTTVDGVIGKLPPVGDLEKLVRRLGVDNDDHVVVMPAGKNSLDFGSAARIYWTFKVLGHDDVSILDGGYAAWVKAGAPVESGETMPFPTEFSASFRPEMVASTVDVLDVVKGGGAQLIDARPAKQFVGAAKHKKARVAGTIPGAINVPEGTLVPGKGDHALSGADLDVILAAAKVTGSDKKITFCNTGHWAATAWFALSELGGDENVTMYDGSMVEWTRFKDLPLQKATAAIN